MPNITNAQVDAAAAAIPVSWFGPATRVTNVQSPQLTNTNDFVVTVPHGHGNTTSVTINYDELTNPYEYKPIIFGAVIDDIAASVSSPYGPIVRTTDIEDLPTGESAFEQPITFTTAAPYSTTFEIPYNKLKHPSYLNAAIERSVGVQGIVNDLKVSIGTLKTYADTLTAPHTQADLQALVDKIVELSLQAANIALL